MSLLCAFRISQASLDEGKPDELCQILFKHLTSSPRDDVDPATASDIIASRGRTRGFWKPVFDELKNGHSWDEQWCIRILGKMLEADAAARDYIEAKAMTPQMQKVCLPSSVVPELIARCEKRVLMRDPYLVALARARDKRCETLLLRVLRDDSSFSYNESEKFHAAVGLANIGNTVGVRWMMDHCNSLNKDVEVAWPARRGFLDVSCVLALRSLSNRSDLTSRAEFEQWWQSLPKPFGLNHPIALADR